MLETVKNTLVGRVHDPHSYLIERGCHSMTMVSKPAGKDSAPTEKETLQNLARVLETLIRANDALDE